MPEARIRRQVLADRPELYLPGSLANTPMVGSMHLRQYSRNELIVLLLARHDVPGRERLGRTHIMGTARETGPMSSLPTPRACPEEPRNTP